MQILIVLILMVATLHFLISMVRPIYPFKKRIHALGAYLVLTIFGGGVISGLDKAELQILKETDPAAYELRIAEREAEKAGRKAARQARKKGGDRDAVGVVAKSIATNKLGVTANDLQSKDSPRGDGTFVYVPKTRFYGVERYVIWMVISGQAFPLNGPSKLVTPSLPWPRDAAEDLWTQTNLSPYSASDAIEIVFGE